MFAHSKALNKNVQYLKLNLTLKSHKDKTKYEMLEIRLYREEIYEMMKDLNERKVIEQYEALGCILECRNGRASL